MACRCPCPACPLHAVRSFSSAGSRCFLRILAALACARILLERRALTRLQPAGAYRPVGQRGSENGDAEHPQAERRRSACKEFKHGPAPSSVRGICSGNGNAGRGSGVPNAAICSKGGKKEPEPRHFPRSGKVELRQGG